MLTENEQSSGQSERSAAEQQKPVVMHLDFRPLKLETRTVREGSALHFEGRSGRVNADGSVDWRAWMRTGTIPNYGDVFDPKPRGLLARLLGA